MGCGGSYTGSARLCGFAGVLGARDGGFWVVLGLTLVMGGDG